MKLIILLMCVSFFQITANVFSQNTIIKLDKETGTFGEIIQAIEEQSDFKVFYKNEQIDLKREVKIKEKSAKNF